MIKREDWGNTIIGGRRSGKFLLIEKAKANFPLQREEARRPKEKKVLERDEKKAS